MTLAETLAAIRPADTSAAVRAAERHVRLTKPPGSLGVLEEVSVRLAGIEAFTELRWLTLQTTQRQYPF